MASWFWQPKQVRIHVHGQEQSIDGILISRPNHFYRLAQPKLVVAENISQALDGEAWVPSDRVLFLQVLTQ
jgi:hypothetical protein